MDEQFVGNVAALKAVQPVDLSATEIDARLGSTWIPAEDVQLFASQVLNEEGITVTPPESLPLQWSRAGVATVRWRPAATFTLVPSDNILPLVLSTGGPCLSFNRTLRRISFESLPLAVAGRHGRGRFALFGGPHLFETSPLGLLAHGDNTKFLNNVIGWLLKDNEAVEAPGISNTTPTIPESQPGLTHVESYGNGDPTSA